MALDPNDPAPEGAKGPVGSSAPAQAAAQVEAPLPRGAAVGRYLVVDLLGAGGMGRVYAAYDPVLDRRVALKLLRGALPGSPEGQARLLREAQAMARLSHPNVLVVHDVGTHEGQVFVAMELVDGGTLAEWLAAPRTQGEVLRVFRDAALGLAAAHAVGIVHRDFKPENVLLGGGRVFVADFGLARSTGEAEPAPLPGAGEDLGALAQRLTQTGALVGTPAYMAPEQFLGWPSDARTDQFSYCVALYEALYGQRPFAGDRAEALALAALEGQVRPPPPGRAAPPWLHALLLRGLAPRPGDRFPDMAALLAEIARHEGAARRRRRLLAYGGAAALALLGAALLGQQAVSRRARLCGGAESQLAGVWDGPRREQARRALLASGKPYAASVFAEVDRALSAYAGAWAGMRREACEATRVRGEQSEELLDLRMTCLDQRLREARALSDLLGASGATLAERAASAANSLSSLQGCADGAALRALLRPPTAEAAARVQAARAPLARAKALRDAGQYAAGLPVAREATAAARAIGYAPLLAEALYQQGDLETEAGEHKASEESLREAVDAAIAGRHGRVAAQAAARLVFVVGFQLARPREGHLWRRQGEAHLSALGGDDEERARLLSSVAAVLIAEGRYGDAVAPLNEALALRRRALGPAHPAAAQCLLLLGNVAYFQGKYDEALGHYRAAIPIWERAQGPAHPYVAYALSNISAVELAQGKHAAAAETSRRALAIEEAALGPEHPSLADPLDNLGAALSALGRDAEAEAPLRRAVALHERALGSEHRDLALHLRGLGDVLRRLGRRDEAGALLERARRIQQQALGGDHPDLAETLASLAALRADGGDRRGARALLEQAAAMAERKLGAAHPSARRYRQELARLPAP